MGVSVRVKVRVRVRVGVGVRAAVGADAHAAVEISADLDERREGLGDVLAVAQEVLVGLVRQVVLGRGGGRVGLRLRARLRPE